jgi:sodium transport system ATP-binding protein
MADAGPSIQLEGLSKSFGANRVVDGVSLTVRAGEVVGLLGPNGAGKTTTLRMLAGLLTPSAGWATVCGIEVTSEPLEARRRMGFLTASTGLYDRLTPRELMTTFGRLHGMEKDAIAARVETVSRELDMGSFLDKRCGTLSSGQKQRASIGRAVVHDPDVYVLDEPTAMLDPLASKGILDLVRAVSARGKAVLFSTHRMEEAEFLCHRLCFMRSGQVVAEGSAEQLRARSGEKTLTAAFLHYAMAEGRR